MSRPWKVTPELITDIQKRLVSGETATAIARSLNLSTMTVSNLAARLGIGLKRGRPRGSSEGLDRFLARHAGIIADANAGMTFAAIGRKWGKTRARIGQISAKVGVGRRAPVMPWDRNEEFVFKRLWDEGLTAAEIGRRLGFTTNAILGKAFRMGLPKRSRGRRAK